MINEQIIGKTFGNLTVISTDHTNIKPDYYVCLCDCGDRYTVFGPRLRRLDTTKCIDCSIRDRCKKITPNIVPEFYWKRTQYGAKQRNIDFSIDIGYGQKIFDEQKGRCALSGQPIIFSPTKSSHRDLLTASLDRIDSDIGYVQNNVQWLHKEINLIKGNIPNDLFINICKGIYRKQLYEN